MHRRKPPLLPWRVVEKQQNQMQKEDTTIDDKDLDDAESCDAAMEADDVAECQDAIIGFLEGQNDHETEEETHYSTSTKTVHVTHTTTSSTLQL